MQLGRKLAEGYASDPEADDTERPAVVSETEKRPEAEPVEQPARV